MRIRLEHQFSRAWAGGWTLLRCIARGPKPIIALLTTSKGRIALPYQSKARRCNDAGARYYVNHRTRHYRILRQTMRANKHHQIAHRITVPRWKKEASFGRCRCGLTDGHQIVDSISHQQTTFDVSRTQRLSAQAQRCYGTQTNGPTYEGDIGVFCKGSRSLRGIRAWIARSTDVK